MELRAFTAADEAALLGWFPDEAALVQWGGPDMRFPLDRAQLVAMRQEAEGDPSARWLLSGVEDGALAGHVQVPFDWRHGVARLSRVAISPAFRGRRLAEPFLASVVARVFAETGIERLELNVYTFNEAAIRTYRALGFVEEGVRRSSVRIGEARWDTAIFGLLRRELPPYAL